jgi:hypothetical protein
VQGGAGSGWRPAPGPPCPLRGYGQYISLLGTGPAAEMRESAGGQAAFFDG